MKLNKITAITLAASFLALATSCGDKFLTVDNPTAQPIEEYFNTESHLIEALNAAYDPLQWTDYTSFGGYNPLPLMSDIMADDIWPGGSDRTDNHYYHLMAEYASTPTSCMTGLWTIGYSGVKRSNDCLTYIGWVEGLDSGVARSVEAQCRVLRAMYYSWLWKFWGNIPYYEENLVDPFVCEQFKADDVYEKIMTDLEGAIAIDALPMKCTPDEAGHITKATAYMLFAELAMYQNDASRLPKALEYMKEIIECGQYSLKDNFNAVFAAENEWCDESIFEIIYRADQSARSWGNPIYAGGSCITRLIGPDSWAAGTPADSPHDNGWGFCTVRTSTYDMYKEGDSRREATCWNAKAIGSYNPRYQDTGLFLEKYVGQTTNAGQIADGDLNYNKNIRYYRFSETLLNAAELVIAGYGSGDAQGWLNQVHSRSGLTDTVDATMDNIKQERHWEFVGEGKRYWDLIRWGDAASVLTADYTNNADRNFTETRSKGKQFSWKPEAKYLPIPQSEIDAAAGTAYPLTQNPSTGYVSNE